MNDATALVAYQVAITAVVAGVFSWQDAGLEFLQKGAGGLIVGLALGWLIYPLVRRLQDPPIEITLSLLIPYAAYLIADKLGLSGVLSVVACGLYLGRRSSRGFAAETRLQAAAVWQMAVFFAKWHGVHIHRPAVARGSTRPNLLFGV